MIIVHLDIEVASIYIFKALWRIEYILENIARVYMNYSYGGRGAEQSMGVVL